MVRAERWSFIQEHLPNYGGRTEVMAVDIYSRYLYGMDIDECDYDILIKGKGYYEILQLEKSLINTLYVEAVKVVECANL